MFESDQYSLKSKYLGRLLFRMAKQEKFTFNGRYITDEIEKWTEQEEQLSKLCGVRDNYVS